MYTYSKGDTYWYTDYATGVKLSDGDTSVTTDMIPVTVDTEKAPGSQLNPYVIDGTLGWQAFVNYVAKSGVNYGAGKYFVLNSDIDYAGGEIPLVARFAGTFYGVGNSILNAKYQDRYSVDEQKLGLFCYVTGTPYISDLSVLNFTIDTKTIHIGVIVGAAGENNNVVMIVNCTTKGKITQLAVKVPTVGYLTNSQTWSVVVGGIMGSSEGCNGQVKFYKNSSDIISEQTMNRGQFASQSRASKNTSNGVNTWSICGGMLGISDYTSHGNIYFYDCYASVNLTAKTDKWSSGAFNGFVGFSRYTPKSVYRNCVYIATYNVDSNYVTVSAAKKNDGSHYQVFDHGLLTTFGEGGTQDLDCKNFYGYGMTTWKGNTYAVPFVGRYYGTYTTTSRVENVNVYSNGNTNYTSNGTAAENAVAGAVPSTASKPYTTSTDLEAWKTAAMGGLTNEKIWNSGVLDDVQAPAAGTTTIITPDISDVPILINRIRVSYHEYKGNRDVACSFVTDAEELHDVKINQSLPIPTGSAIPEGRKFLGWTTDKTGESKPFMEVPNTLHGDNKLYAVWGIDTDSGVTVSAEIGAQKGGRDLEYGANGFESIYTASGIKLYIKNLDVSGVGGSGDSLMSDAVDYDWQWIKGNTNIANANQETYTVKNVKDSDSYKVTLQYRSEQEPLFKGTLTLAAKQVTITKAPLYLSDFKFGENVHPYSGAPFTTAVPTATVTNTEVGGDEIKGTTSWYLPSGKFNSVNPDADPNPDAGIIKEKNGKLYQTKTIWFECDESYNGNYGDPDDIDEGGNLIKRNGQKFEIEFEIEYVQFVFKIDKYLVRPFVYVNLQYGQNYTYYNVAAMFEEAFKNNMSDFPGLTPVFQKGTDEWTINEYRNEAGTAYKNVTEICELTVLFREEKYKVTYDPLNGENVFEDENSPIGYGIRLNEPLPAPVNEDKLFLGWFYMVDEVDKDGNVLKDVEKQWDFNNDIITREMNLYARWLSADTLEQELKVVVDPSAVFYANAPLDTSLLTVTATFSGKDGEDTYKSESILSFGQYEIDYGEGNIDGKLHIVGNDKDGIQPTTVYIRYTVRIGGKSQTAFKQLDLDLERIKVDTSKLEPFFHDTTVEWEDGKVQSLEIGEADIREAGLFAYIKTTVKYEYSKDGQSVNPEDVIEEGEYVIRASFETRSKDYDAPSITATLTIVPEKIALSLLWDKTEFTYNGKVQIPVFTFKYADRDKVVKVNYSVVDTHGDEHTGDEVDMCLNAIKVGSYSVKVVLSDSGYKFDGESGNNFMIVPFTITKAQVELPEQIEALEYCGRQYDLNSLDPELCKTYFKNFDPDIMQVVGGATGTTVGSYNAFITLKDPSSASWKNNVTRATMEWMIKKAQLSVYWGNVKSFEENGTVQYPKVVHFVGLLGTDADAVDLDKDVVYNLAGVKAEVGGYTISMSFSSSASWAKNYELDDTKKFSFAIVPVGASGFTLVSVEWVTTTFKFNEGWQKPVFKLVTEDGNENVTEELIDYILCDGVNWSLWSGNMWAGKYEVTLTIDPASEYAETHFLVGKPTCQYTILKDGDKGDDPNYNVTPQPENPNGSGNTGDDNREDTSNLPIWQLIVTGVSAVLFVVCAAKAFSNYGKAKAAKKETQRLAAITYSFVGTPLLAIEFLGMGETPWTIIACVTLGLFLIAFAAMLIMGKKRKDAELALAREEARIADEKEYAREEEQLRREEEMRAEQRRRDEEFKMMFAAMQQGNQSQYGDMQNLLATVTALLPGIQQMQALPPAQGDMNAYNAPQQNYGAPQNDYTAPNYGAPQQNSETDALRAQMAAQEERMARQEALINELMQERQANRGYSAPAVQADEVAAANMRREELLTQFDAKDGTPVSLEESYGNLSDEAKRFYYEIGCFIMERPNVMQNDGKYAVLFKYRGKTLFKLSIRGNAPVLTYIQNGAPAEHCVVDESSLGYAKQIMAACITETDRELDS